ncbi:MAG: hypothetical protein HUJ68_03500 [Clostridia bacterium]|nr:hypothetical protein [Clostridia bacterium]
MTNQELIRKIVELCLGGYDSIRISLITKVPHDLVVEALEHCFTVGKLSIDRDGYPVLKL